MQMALCCVPMMSLYRVKNVDILGVVLAKSAVEVPLTWNIQVSTWLRHYVYERLLQKGKKLGLFHLLAIQTVTAVWHGREISRALQLHRVMKFTKLLKTAK